MTPDPASAAAIRIAEVLPELIELRHAIHQHPELKYEEEQTAARVCDALEGLPGMELRTGVAGTGVVATLGAERQGEGIALRADMDALPMPEQTGKPWASRVPGKMHACGHDGHVTCLVGAARVLASMAERLGGPVKFIFQPAEEGGAGGRRMCEEGVLENPSVAAIFGLHAWPELPQGEVGLRPGAALASADGLQIQVTGRGAHAAYPHMGIDPILIASHIVVALQSVVSRNVDPQDSAVVTVAQIAGGTAGNIIPPEVTLQGTIRSLNPDTRSLLWERVESVATHTARAMGGAATTRIDEGYPALANDVRAHDLVARVLEEPGIPLSGRLVPPVMGAEDFAYYAERVPAMFSNLGIRPPGGDSHPHLHQPDFDFPDEALPLGVRLHVEVVLRFWDLWPQLAETA
ncbi:M20 family metallopeptidase [Candidatus Latescibacterota bacterium]